VRDCAIEVDAEGPTMWDCTEYLDSLTSEARAPVMIEGTSHGGYASDRLREADTAPSWVKEWGGPFEIRLEEMEAPRTVEDLVAAMSLEQKEFVVVSAIRSLFWDYDADALNPDNEVDCTDAVMDMTENIGTVLAELGVTAPTSTDEEE
jgi:hypothetical protein